MHHHTNYRGRIHTQKQNRFKSKLSDEEREIRAARKKFFKLFPNIRIHQHYLTCNSPFTLADSLNNSAK